jgi:3-hydroxyisobutyrate dehydrogenase-like beta-hydroxyacid dehydrogenase
MTTVGIAGLGRMGGAIGLHLIEQGHSLVVWNRSAAKAEPLKAAGARVAATPKALVEASDIVITSLTDDKAATDCFHRADGLLAGASSKTLFVETTTTSPATARSLAAAAAAAGAVLLDCPVQGSADAARKGQLLAMIGGDPEALDRARPVIEAFTRKLFHLGPVGSSAALKLAVNTGIATYAAFLGEATRLCALEGIAPEAVYDVIAEGPMATPILKGKMAILKGEGDPNAVPASDIDLFLKDASAALILAAQHRTALPVAAATQALLADAAKAGWGACDYGDLPAFARSGKPR